MPASVIGELCHPEPSENPVTLYLLLVLLLNPHLTLILVCSAESLWSASPLQGSANHILWHLHSSCPSGQEARGTREAALVILASSHIRNRPSVSRPGLPSCFSVTDFDSRAACYIAQILKGQRIVEFVYPDISPC